MRRKIDVRAVAYESSPEMFCYIQRAPLSAVSSATSKFYPTKFGHWRTETDNPIFPDDYDKVLADHGWRRISDWEPGEIKFGGYSCKIEKEKINV